MRVVRLQGLQSLSDGGVSSLAAFTYGFFTVHARYENLFISFAFSLLMFGDKVNCKLLHKAEVTKVSDQ